MKWLIFSCLCAQALCRYQEPSVFVEIMEAHRRQCSSTAISSAMAFLNEPIFIRLHRMISSPEFEELHSDPKAADSWSYNVLDQVGIAPRSLFVQVMRGNFKRLRKVLGFKMQFEEIMNRSPRRWSIVLEAVKTCELYRMQLLLKQFVQSDSINLTFIPAEIKLAHRKDGFDSVPPFYSRLSELSKLYFLKAISVWSVIISNSHSAVLNSQRVTDELVQCMSILLNEYSTFSTPLSIIKAKIEAFEKMNMKGVHSTMQGFICAYMKLTIWFFEETYSLDFGDIEERVVKLLGSSFTDAQIESRMQQIVRMATKTTKEQ